ncbi:MAG: ABC transporter substrate-binding protein [Rhodothermales bacterium]
MVNRFFYTWLILGLMFSAGSVAFAQSSSDEKAAEVRELLVERDQEIKRVVGDRSTFTDEQRERLKNVVNGGIDFEAMARTALGPFWADLSTDERDEFVNVFSSIVRNQSLSNLDVYRSEVSFEKITVSGDTARAVTTTVYRGVPTTVEYVLGLKNGSWRVNDIILDDVSTAEGYARSFQTVVRRRGFESLMESLRKKLATMES